MHIYSVKQVIPPSLLLGCVEHLHSWTTGLHWCDWQWWPAQWKVLGRGCTHGEQKDQLYPFFCYLLHNLNVNQWMCFLRTHFLSILLYFHLRACTQMCQYIKCLMCSSLVTRVIILILWQSKDGGWKVVKPRFRFLSAFHLFPLHLFFYFSTCTESLQCFTSLLISLLTHSWIVRYSSFIFPVVSDFLCSFLHLSACAWSVSWIISTSPLGFSYSFILTHSLHLCSPFSLLHIYCRRFRFFPSHAGVIVSIQTMWWIHGNKQEPTHVTTAAT